MDWRMQWNRRANSNKIYFHWITLFSVENSQCLVGCQENVFVASFRNKEENGRVSRAYMEMEEIESELWKYKLENGPIWKRTGGDGRWLSFHVGALERCRMFNSRKEQSVIKQTFQVEVKYLYRVWAPAGWVRRFVARCPVSPWSAFASPLAPPPIAIPGFSAIAVQAYEASKNWMQVCSRWRASFEICHKCWVVPVSACLLCGLPTRLSFLRVLSAAEVFAFRNSFPVSLWTAEKEIAQ